MLQFSVVVPAWKVLSFRSNMNMATSTLPQKIDMFGFFDELMLQRCTRGDGVIRDVLFVENGEEVLKLSFEMAKLEIKKRLEMLRRTSSKEGKVSSVTFEINCHPIFLDFVSDSCKSANLTLMYRNGNNLTRFFIAQFPK
jgi:hypothetical protein